MKTSEQQRKACIPSQSLLKGKPWTPPADTDVQRTWRAFGWTPSRRTQ